MNLPITNHYSPITALFRPSTFILIAVACVALLTKVQAVVPAPDGGYPGGNTAEGQNALFSLATGGYNTAVGYLSLRSDATGSFNTAIGAGAVLANTADQNTAIGAAALLSNTTGSYNTANGAFALFNNSSGSNNTVIGQGALRSNTEGSNNVVIGQNALPINSTGSDNTVIGTATGTEVTGSGNVCIGAGVVGESGDNHTWIRNVYNSVATIRAVYVGSDDKLGTLSSSRRYKQDIRGMNSLSEALFALRPVTFRYKREIDPAQARSFGLLAEDVAEISPDLITCDKQGRPETVRYEAVNAMLLNEFLKEHKTVQKQETSITELKRGIEALTAQLKQQAAQIQKVSAQIEMTKPVPQIVRNNP